MDSAPFPTLCSPLSSGGLPLPAPFHSVELLGHSPEAHRVLPMGALPVPRRGPRFPRFPGRHLSCEGERRHDPHPLRGMVTPRCPPVGACSAPELPGGVPGQRQSLQRGGRSTHPRSLKGVAASPRCLPWHQVQGPQGSKVSARSESAPMGRGGSVPCEKGQRPTAGPSCASLLRTPKSTMRSRGSIPRPPTPHHAPPSDSPPPL